jgi:hypothetical protein
MKGWPRDDRFPPLEALASEGPVRDDYARSLAEEGFALIDWRCASASLARAAALQVCRHAARLNPWAALIPSLQVVGEFRIPVASAQARDFQALHFDFGLPLQPRLPRDIAHYTMLYVSPETGHTEAFTRLVNLAELLAQRPWPDGDTLVRRLAAYGESHGAWDPAEGYTEGILGRLVEAAHGADAALPSVNATPDFLCGTEFLDRNDETRFLASHGLSLEACETAIRIEPGQVLIFDNLQVAHGRQGRRTARELHQVVFGYPAVGVAGQLQIRERILSAFSTSAYMRTSAPTS